jgi:hypothetical protein
MSDADEVEVRTRFDGAWTGGYELHDADPRDGDPRFKVRRRSDGTVLPGWFEADEIRRQPTASDVVDDFERRLLTDPDTQLPPPAGRG